MFSWLDVSEKRFSSICGMPELTELTRKGKCVHAKSWVTYLLLSIDSRVLSTSPRDSNTRGGDSRSQSQMQINTRRLATWSNQVLTRALHTQHCQSVLEKARLELLGAEVGKETLPDWREARQLQAELANCDLGHERASKLDIVHVPSEILRASLLLIEQIAIAASRVEYCIQRCRPLQKQTGRR